MTAGPRPVADLPASDANSGAAQGPRRILVSGYFGFGNTGDEAILAALASLVSQVAPDARLVALSADPVGTRQLGIDAVQRLDIPAIWAELRRASLFISGGGSLLQDVTGPGSVPYYTGLMALARLAGTPAIMLGQGVGPLRHGASRHLVGGVVSRLQAVTVRDEASASLLVACGVPADAIEVTADPVLALPPAADHVVEGIWARLGLDPGRPVVAVSLRPWRSWTEQGLKTLSAVLAQTASDWHAQVLLLPFHHPDDRWLLDELAQCLAARPEPQRPPLLMLEDVLSPAEMMGLLKRVDMVLGMRLHALIMAAAVGTPCVAVVYDPKVEAFARQAGFPALPSVEAVREADALANLLREAWATRLEARQVLAAKAEGWRIKARRNVEVALSVARPGVVRGG
ncbi:MAG: polysaccharide pyruvyl transferase CsaB [Candidatus Sericytochromatia bacterium]|nr:polysaccharide pyruvyl transferase CsaB [Candidatus Sericytochromatia bacterium]